MYVCIHRLYVPLQLKEHGSNITLHLLAGEFPHCTHYNRVTATSAVPSPTRGRRSQSNPSNRPTVCSTSVCLTTSQLQYTNSPGGTIMKVKVNSNGAREQCSMHAQWLISKLCKKNPLALCTLGAQEVTTNGMYRLPHAIYYCS